MANINPNTIPGLPLSQDPMYNPYGAMGFPNPNPTGSNMVPDSNPSAPVSFLGPPVGGSTSTGANGGLVDNPIVPGTGNINTGPAGTFNPTFMSGLNPSASTGIPAVGSTDYTNLSKQLDSIFGSGMGSVLLGYLSGGGGFNPQVAAALQNAQIPQEQRALANIREAFGAQGLGGGSNEALAVGDYESAFNLGQEGILANLYQGGANNIRDILSGTLNTAFLNKSNKMTNLDYINSLLPILSATGILGGQNGGILGGLLKSGISGLGRLLGKLFGIGGGNNNSDTTLIDVLNQLPIPVINIPGTGNDIGLPPTDETGGTSPAFGSSGNDWFWGGF